MRSKSIWLGAGAVVILVASLLLALQRPGVERARPGTARSGPVHSGAPALRPVPLPPIVRTQMVPLGRSPLPPPPVEEPRAPDWQDGTPLGLPSCDDYRAALQRFERCRATSLYGKQIELDRWRMLRGPRMPEIPHADAEALATLEQACADEARTLSEAADASLCPS